MSKRKKNEPVETAAKSFVLDSQIKTLVKGLYYISETDAEISPFVGVETEEVSTAEMLKQIGKSADTPIEKQDFDEFFVRLTKIQDWFGDEEKASAAKFTGLRELLKNNLRDLAVFKIGSIQIEIYAVGLPSENILAGIQTKAVET